MNARSIYRGNLRFLLIIVAVFGAELLVHEALATVRTVSPLFQAIGDALALALLSIPFVAYMLSRRVARLRAESQAESIMQGSLDGIVTSDGSGKLSRLNASAEKIFGYQSGEVAGRHIGLLLPERRHSPERMADSHFLAGSRDGWTPRVIQAEGQRNNGERFPAEIITVQTGEGDRAVRTTVVHDLTARVRLNEDRALQLAALNSAADPIVITDRDGNIKWVNAAFTATTGYDAGEAIGRNPRALLKSGAHDVMVYKQLWDTILAGNVWRGELINRRKDGTRYPEMNSITPVRDARGEISHFIAVKRDLTKEKQLQSEYLQAQKLESVGRLVGGIAHDFNNLLSVIIGWTELAMAELPKGHDSRPPLEEVLNAGHGAARLTRQLLAFSRRQNVELTVFDVNVLVGEVEKMVRRLVGEDVRFVIRTTPEANCVRMDHGQLEQVLMNLVVNARDAMPEGGQIIIETATVRVDADAHAELPAGEYVTVAVSDSGTGMSDDVKAHLFEPFFTTKERGKGTGLGLATCYGIVQQANGHIDVHSEVGTGTTMTIFLPLTRQAPATERADGAKATRGAETVLLVDDDASVRRMTTRVLESRGYRVLSAPNGLEALQLLEAQREPVQLLLTDVVLADGMSGPLLAERVRLMRPEMKVLFVSGYTSDVTLLHGLRDLGDAFVQKPFTADTLCTNVRQLMAAPRRATAGPP